VTVETLALDFAGPLAAGALFVLAPWAPFALSAVCFVVAAAVIGTLGSTPLPTAANRRHGIAPLPSAGDLPPWASIRAGLGKLFGDPVLRVLVITVAIMAIANAATDAVLVLYGTQTLGMSEALYPTLLVAYSVGTLAAAALVGRANSRARGGQVMIVALFGISATMLILGLIPSIVVALAAFAVMGLAGGTWNVLSASRRQRQTPHGMIGRVSSAFRVVAWGVIPLGAGIGGLIGEKFGVSAVYFVAGGVIALLGLAVGRSFLRAEPVAASTTESAS
jgi:predicted MFS family arabinose efflux permease